MKRKPLVPPPIRQAGEVWSLRRGDQATVAVLAAVAIVVISAWCGWQGTGASRLVEIDDAPRRAPVFLVDVNAADEEELAQLPGVGPTIAERIVHSRADEGPYASIDDLLRVRGVGPKTLDRVRPFIKPPAASP